MAGGNQRHAAAPHCRASLIGATADAHAGAREAAKAQPLAISRNGRFAKRFRNIGRHRV